jgi:hypothetical protein
MRAESFYNFATYIDQVSNLRAYGGKSLHEQSHGESFMSLFANRFEQGIYILDEPEAALSPQRQLSFLKIIHDLATPGHAQFLIATHSPIILSYPDAVLYTLDGDAIHEIGYRETKHFLITRDFLNSPEGFSSISSVRRTITTVMLKRRSDPPAATGGDAESSRGQAITKPYRLREPLQRLPTRIVAAHGYRHAFGRSAEGLKAVTYCRVVRFYRASRKEWRSQVVADVRGGLKSATSVGSRHANPHDHRRRVSLGIRRVWCARGDSNPRPLAPEANALSS